MNRPDQNNSQMIARCPKDRRERTVTECRISKSQTGLIGAQVRDDPTRKLNHRLRVWPFEDPNQWLNQMRCECFSKWDIRRAIKPGLNQTLQFL